jgi:hypothetical protein
MESDPCGGVLVNATLETPLVRLVGRWEKGALILTESPRPAMNETPFPDPCKQDVGSVPQADMLALQDRVIRDSAFQTGRIQFLMSMPCASGLFILVAVADPDTVNYLESRYPGIAVAGWLQPVQSGF